MKVSVILSNKSTSEVATIAPDATIGDAVAKLSAEGIGALVVSPGNGEIAGILSERDIVRGLGESGSGALERPVSELMTIGVQTCTSDDTAIGLLGRMTRGRFRHLPVVGSNGRMTGILSIGDVVKARLEEMEAENRAMAEMLSS
jgi:CBS domain-containing protein